MKYLILLALLCGCAEATKDNPRAEEFCKDKGGLAFFRIYSEVVCKNGTTVRN